MAKKKLYNRLLILGIAGSLTISSGIVAFADNVKGTDSLKSKIEAKFGSQRKVGGFKGDVQKGGMLKGDFLATILESQVTAGVITKDEAESVTAFLKTKEAAKLAEMQAEKAKLDAMTDAEKKAALEAKKAEKTAEMAKLEAMTMEEREAYMKANGHDGVNIFAELVTAGILTQDKADKIKAAMPQRIDKGQQGMMGSKFGKQPRNFLAGGLSNQVTAGVITQDEADKITVFLETKTDAMKAKMDAEKAKLDAMTDAEKKVARESKKAERDAEIAKIKAMTTEEREAYMKANRPEQSDIFVELVTAGILTQDKADKLKVAIPQRFEKIREKGSYKDQTTVQDANTNSL